MRENGNLFQELFNRVSTLMKSLTSFQACSGCLELRRRWMYLILRHLLTSRLGLPPNVADVMLGAIETLIRGTNEAGGLGASRATSTFVAREHGATQVTIVQSLIGLGPARQRLLEERGQLLGRDHVRGLVGTSLRALLARLFPGRDTSRP